MTTQEKAISFNAFFMIEFMNRVLEKARARFTPHVVEILETLANSLKEAEKPVLVLEKLAQFQETNDMSIFLFDMLNRIEKIAPEKAVDALDGWSDDFINLYELMIEDTDTMTILEVLSKDLEESQQKALEKKEKSRPEKTLAKEKPITFEEFYRQEAQLQLLTALPEEARDEFSSFLKIALQEEKEPETLAEPLAELLALVRRLFPKGKQDVAPEKMMEELQGMVKQISERFERFKKEQAELLQRILKDGELPRKTEPEEKGEMTIDALLKEYFRSEVLDHIKLIEQTLSQPFSPKAIDSIVKYLKSLKEVSMIHGYTGMEYLCERLMETFRAHKDKIDTFSSPFLEAMKNILGELNALEKFDYDVRDQKMRSQVEGIISMLEGAINLTEKKEAEILEEPEAPEEEGSEQEQVSSGQKEAEEITQAQPEEEITPAEQPEAIIGLQDRTQIITVFRELLETITQRLQPFAEEGNATGFLNAIQTVAKSAEWIDETLGESFFDSFLTVYETVLQNDRLKKEEVLPVLSQAWQTFLQELEPDLKLEQTKNFWKTFSLEEFMGPEQEALYAFDDQQAIKALAESMQKLWQEKMSDQLEAAVTRGDTTALEALKGFVKLLQKNLKTLHLESYLALPVFFEKQFIRQEKRIHNSVLIDEIRQTFGLYFERLAEKGRQGDSKDLADVLDEVLAEEVALVSTTEEEVSEDEKEFISESMEHLQKAQERLAGLKINPGKRVLFKELAREIHPIYSAAQFLNREKIADAAIVVEEAAEMFAAPEVPLPEGWQERFGKALQALREMVENRSIQNLEAFEALQAMLDQLVLEEPRQKENIEVGKEELPSEVEEKPLFSSKITDEKELREIFKEDARNLMNTLFQANKALLRNPVDEEAIRELDQAVHSLKNAAKMTGLDDLALVFGRFEEVSEQLKDHVSLSTKMLQEKIADVLKELEPLIFKGELDAVDLDSILGRMDELVSDVIKAHEGEEERNKRLRALFVEESRELIAKINHDLIELEKVPESGTILAELLRHLHTLKGGAMMSGFNKIGELAHKLEDYFQLYRDQNAETKLELLPTAFTIIDLISEMVRSIEQGKPEIVSEFTARLADIDNKLFYLKDFEIPKELKQEEKKIAAKEPLAVQEADNTIRIKASFVDHLVNLVTELVVNRTDLLSHFDMLKKLAADLENRKKDMRHFTHQFEDFLEESAFNNQKDLPPSAKQDYDMLTRFLDNLKNIFGNVSEISGSFDKIMRSLEKNLSQLSVLSKSLHGDLLKARMMPIRLLFERFERAVHDLAQKQGKQVELIIEDNGAELDRAMVEALYEPLLHIIRNAVDHGIEKPAERKKLNKDPKGKITLRARQEKSQVVIDIVDDGRGIDPEKIRSKIVELKLMKKKEAQQLSESRLLEYIFVPEFSTSEETTDVSGRGIGLDVVLSEIQKLKGIVRVKTRVNQGTLFSIRVPLTLIVSQAMLVKFHDQQVAIPLVAVMESLEIGEQDILLDDKRSYVQVRGKLLPYVDIDAVLRMPADEAKELKPKSTAVILHDSGVSIALGIEEIIGRQDIVIKNLGSLLQNVDLISGGTILASGEVALILDYAALIHKVEIEFFGASRENQLVRKIISSKRKRKPVEANGLIDQGQIVPKKISGREPVVLVVDDAMSVREFISSFLERNGFKTLKAENGKQALELIRKQPVDVMITDLEMPVMHGFDLIKKVRKMVQYADLPVIILTAQAGSNFQEKAEEIGANAFISKPFKEGDLLRMINMFVQT